MNKLRYRQMSGESLYIRFNSLNVLSYYHFLVYDIVFQLINV